MGNPTKEELEVLVGLSTEEAREVVPGAIIRVAVLDGEIRRGPADYRPGRINVAVRGGLIVKIVGLG